MVIGSTFLVVCFLVIGIWILVEVKRLKHKVFAVFLIGLILFSYFSFATIFKDSDINFKSADGLIEAGRIYFSWLTSLFVNFKTITINAIKMNWGLNESISSGI